MYALCRLFFLQEQQQHTFFVLKVLQSQLIFEIFFSASFENESQCKCFPPYALQLTAFAFRDYVHFGYVDQGDTRNTQLLRQFNINSYFPIMLLFKEDTKNPVDIIQVLSKHVELWVILR